ncbi:MAG TPA: MATE family efflux transporter [Alphaproteobacteria bacterium]|nr:MATE family efflux transporter [Alphaproteobacteria bacterium]
MNDLLEQKTRQITEGSLLKALLRLALPIIIAQSLSTSYQLVNTFWVGRLGAAAVAAVSLSGPLVFVLISLGGGLSIAGAVFVAQYSGARQTEKVNHVAAQTILMVAGVGLSFTLIGLLSAHAVLTFMGVGPDLMPKALAYLHISYLGVPLFFGFMIFQSVLQGVGEVRYPLYVIAGSVALNAVLDPLLIFGWGPVDGRGVVGAALATLCSQAFTAIVGMSVLFTGRYGVHLKMTHFTPDFPFMKRAFMLGVPASVEQSARSLGALFLTSLATGFGTVPLAAYGLGTRILMFFFLPMMGLSASTATVVAQNIGAGRMDRAEQTAKVAGWLGFLSLTGLGLLIFPVVGPFSRFLVPADLHVANLGAQFVHVVAPAFGILAVQQVFSGVFRGAGRTMQAMILSIMGQWLLQIPISYMLSIHDKIGVAGIWWGYPVAGVISLVITIWWFSRGAWKNRSLADDKSFPPHMPESVRIEEGGF